MTAEIKAGIHNRFDIEVIDATSGKTRMRSKAENVICNGLYTDILGASSYGWFGQIAFGTGSGTPSASDTGLFSYLGYKNLVPTLNAPILEDSGITLNATGSIVLGETEYVGSTLSEVGIRSRASRLCTHAMLMDMNGNPITITKTNTDIVNIYATVYVHVSGSVFSNGLSISNTKDYTQGSNYQSLDRLLCGIISNHQALSSGQMTYTNCIPYYSTGSDMARVNCTVSLNAGNKAITFTAARAGASMPSVYKPFRCAVFNWISNDFGFFLNGLIDDSYMVEDDSIGTGNGSATSYKTTFSVGQLEGIYVNGVKQSNVVVTKGLNAKRICLAAVDKRYSTMNHLIIDNRVQVGFTNGTIIRIHPTRASADLQNITLCNLDYEDIGIVQLAISATRYTLYAWSGNQNDEYVEVQSGESLAFTVPAQYRNYPFFNLVLGGSVSGYIDITVEDKSTNVIFSEPPAVGSVITANYIPYEIPKDSNHVWDFSITMHLGDYTPE